MKAVVFDIDNTLYPYDVCDRAGIESLYNTYNGFQKISFEDFLKRLYSAKKIVKGRANDTGACHNRLLYAQSLCESGGIFSPEKSLKLYNSYWDAFLEKMELFDGAEAFLRRLKTHGVKIGFCTDLTAHIQFRKIIKLGISDIPDAVVTSEECGHEKPHPSMFMTILDKLKVMPRDALMIGDSLEKDIIGAKECGMNVCLYGQSSDEYPFAESYDRLVELFERMY